jgi:membrane fusion protein YbhG
MRRLVIPIVIVLGVFAWLIVRGGHAGEDVYSGTIEGRDVGVGSRVGGRIVEVAVAEGDSVHAGDVVVRFESDFLIAQVHEQQSRVAQAKASYDRVVSGPRREEIERARVDWEYAEKERKRQEAMLEKNVTTDQVYAAAVAAAEKAYQSYEELRRGSRSEDERQAAGALSEAEAALAFLKAQLDETVVRSPGPGIVQTFDLRVGDLVPAYQPVASILEAGDLWVHVYVPETELGKIHVGQTARLSIDTFPQRPFEAHVIAVRDQAEYTPRNVQTPEQRQDRVFAVKLSVGSSPEIKPGMTATVRFE